MEDGRIKEMLGEHRVKHHIFEPSGRGVWTVVGRREYWAYPEEGFCSCPGNYFGKGCYHLEALAAARREGLVETIRFADDEYAGFMAGLLNDACADLR